MSLHGRLGQLGRAQGQPVRDRRLVSKEAANLDSIPDPNAAIVRYASPDKTATQHGGKRSASFSLLFTLGRVMPTLLAVILTMSFLWQWYKKRFRLNLSLMHLEPRLAQAALLARSALWISSCCFIDIRLEPDPPSQSQPEPAVC